MTGWTYLGSWQRPQEGLDLDLYRGPDGRVAYVDRERYLVAGPRGRPSERVRATLSLMRHALAPENRARNRGDE